MTYAVLILLVVAALIAVFLVIANRDANQAIKKRNFDHVTPGTRSQLAIVPKEARVSGNVASSNAPSESVHQVFGTTSGRVK